MSDQNYHVVMSDNLTTLLYLLLLQGGGCICFRVSKHLDGYSGIFKQTEGPPAKSSLMCSSGAGTTRWNCLKIRKQTSKEHSRNTNRSWAEKVTCCQMASVLFFWEQQTRQFDYISAEGLCTFTAASVCSLDNPKVTEISAVAWVLGHSKIHDPPNWMKQTKI